MADEATTQESTTTGTSDATEASTTETETQAPGGDDQVTETTQADTESTKTEADPEIARLNREVDKLRKEAAANRVKGNEKAEAAAQEAAKKATTELVEKLRETLGLDPAEPDPAELLKAAEKQAADFAAERDSFAEKLREYARKDAISAAAKANDGDLDAILDSRKVTEAVAKLDTNADDYLAQVAEVVSAAVESNPKLKKTAAQAAAPRSGGDLSGGNAASKTRGNPTVDEIRQAKREKRERDGF
ncbi:hypothetical protein [Nocardia thailandica]|uniref:hypothetical protein n=1 Tax=Nocardia thailandica TaxID=257275 RepID=UPI0002D5DBF2|nr:hypothetical protein [Nocardia thailandica]